MPCMLNKDLTQSLQRFCRKSSKWNKSFVHMIGSVMPGWSDLWREEKQLLLMLLNIIVVSRVDYVDSLGRSRRCLRKDLRHLQEMDKDISNQQRLILDIFLTLNLFQCSRSVNVFSLFLHFLWLKAAVWGLGWQHTLICLKWSTEAWTSFYLGCTLQWNANPSLTLYSFSKMI